MILPKKEGRQMKADSRCIACIFKVRVNDDGVDATHPELKANSCKSIRWRGFILSLSLLLYPYPLP
jgi:hypothetical protein